MVFGFTAIVFRIDQSSSSVKPPKNEVNVSNNGKLVETLEPRRILPVPQRYYDIASVANRLRRGPKR